MSIIELVLKEARVDKWALLEQQQMDNMVHQLFAKYKKELILKSPDDFKGKATFSDYVKELKKPYFEYAKKFNDDVIKKIKSGLVDFKTEKLLLVWLLEQIINKKIHKDRISEDAKIITETLDLYFENRKEISKNIFDATYDKVKTWIVKWKPKGEEAKHKEFLSQPDVEGGEYKVYKVTEVDQCIKIGKGTSWCIQGESWAKKYLAKGPLWLVTKNDKRYALLQFESNSYMDVNDNRLKPEEMFGIIDVWPKLEEHLKQGIEKDISLMKYLRNVDEKVMLELLGKNPETFEYFNKPSDKVIRKALELDGSNIKHVSKPSREYQEIALKQDGDHIQHIDNPDEDFQEKAINSNPLAIKHLKNPTQKIQNLAIDKDGDAIEHIRNPSEETQLRAVKSNGLSIRHIIENLKGKMPSDDIQIAAVKQNWKAIKYIPNPSVKVQMAAVEHKWLALSLIHDADPSVVKRAIEINPKAEEFVEHKSF